MIESRLARKFQAPISALEIEAKAIDIGLLLAKDHGFHDVILERDSLIRINL